MKGTQWGTTINKEGRFTLGEVLDVAFYKTLPAAKVAGVTYVDVSPLVAGKPISQLLAGDTFVELTWLNNIPRK